MEPERRRVLLLVLGAVLTAVGAVLVTWFSLGIAGWATILAGVIAVGAANAGARR